MAEVMLILQFRRDRKLIKTPNLNLNRKKVVIDESSSLHRNYLVFDISAFFLEAHQNPKKEERIKLTPS